ncbi:hypothetical protein ACCS68_14375 [Rhizobium beringeri]|uniref:hypothetical protein n=1 Tax=Rhizobium beringeri TaxID=3019934 RepID=UPI003CF199CA
MFDLTKFMGGRGTAITVVVKDQPKKKRDPNKPKMVPAIAKRFHNYRPSFYTKVGLVTAALKKVDISPVTGETVAYYDLVIRDPISGQVESTTYLYAYRGDQIVKVKEFPVRYLNLVPAR